MGIKDPEQLDPRGRPTAILQDRGVCAAGSMFTEAWPALEDPYGAVNTQGVFAGQAPLVKAAGALRRTPGNY